MVPVAKGVTAGSGAKRAAKAPGDPPSDAATLCIPQDTVLSGAVLATVSANPKNWLQKFTNEGSEDVAKLARLIAGDAEPPAWLEVAVVHAINVLRQLLLMESGYPTRAAL